MSKLWDDLKHNMKEWSSAAVEKAEEVSKVAVAKTEELTKISKIKIEVHQLQRDRRRASEALGKLAYGHAKDANAQGKYDTSGGSWEPGQSERILERK